MAHYESLLFLHRTEMETRQCSFSSGWVTHFSPSGQNVMPALQLWNSDRNEEAEIKKERKGSKTQQTACINKMDIDCPLTRDLSFVFFMLAAYPHQMDPYRSVFIFSFPSFNTFASLSWRSFCFHWLRCLHAGLTVGAFSSRADN